MSDDDLDNCDNGIDDDGDTIGNHLDAEFTRMSTCVRRVGQVLLALLVPR